MTGFLGSGKTTLIGRVLRDPRYARTAVIVNEFGEIGLDHDLIATGTETLLQLTTGCLCCAVRTDLVDTLLTLDRQRRDGAIAFDRVLIETSGLADPAPILHALMTDPAMAGAFAIASVVTLVDALLGAATLRRHPEARRQVALADRIVLTKTDLAPVPPELRAVIAGLNATAPVEAGAPPPAALFAAVPRLPADPVTPAARHSAGITTALVLRTTPVPALALTLLLEALAEHCGPRLLRLKGLVDIVEMPGRPAVVHGVQHVFAPVAFLDRWPSDDRRTRIVVIGERLPRHFPARLLDAIAAEVSEAVAAAGADGAGAEPQGQ
ncbi:CobW family GTP-binding protein [Limobrevibacterium gyesilva]|uniref:CobW family GTP-binding protein n=1 Tax=Limobrevibacterium gyesilva TaxID=2991712 RepID=UPI0022273808